MSRIDNEKCRIRNLLVKTVGEFKKKKLTTKRLQILEAEVSKVLLSAAKQGVLDIDKLRGDNEVTATISPADPCSILLSVPAWILDELGIEPYETH